MKIFDRFNNPQRVTWLGVVTNVILTILKLMAGFWGQSRAVIADGVHSLSDILSDFVVLIGIKAGKRPADKSHPYGHGKFETMSTLILSLILFSAAVGMIISAARLIGNFFEGESLAVPSWIALVTAVVSFLIKEILFRLTFRVGTKANSQAIIANAWHHRSDALSSIATTLGVLGAILLGGFWIILDPIAAIAVSFFIIKVSFKIFMKSINEFLEKSLDTQTREKILELIISTKGANKPHNLKTRRIGNQIAIDIHIEVDENLTVADGHDIACQVEDNLRNKFGEATIISVHIEPMDCRQAIDE